MDEPWTDGMVSLTRVPWGVELLGRQTNVPRRVADAVSLEHFDRERPVALGELAAHLVPRIAEFAHLRVADKLVAAAAVQHVTPDPTVVARLHPVAADVHQYLHRRRSTVLGRNVAHACRIAHVLDAVVATVGLPQFLDDLDGSSDPSVQADVAYSAPLPGSTADDVADWALARGNDRVIGSLLARVDLPSDVRARLLSSTFEVPHEHAFWRHWFSVGRFSHSDRDLSPEEATLLVGHVLRTSPPRPPRHGPSNPPPPLDRDRLLLHLARTSDVDVPDDIVGPYLRATPTDVGGLTPEQRTVLARHRTTDPAILEVLAASPDTAMDVVHNRAATTELLLRLDAGEGVLPSGHRVMALLSRSDCPTEILRDLAAAPSGSASSGAVPLALLENPSCPPDLLGEHLHRIHTGYPLATLADRPALTDEALAESVDRAPELTQGLATLLLHRRPAGLAETFAVWTRHPDTTAADALARTRSPGPAVVPLRRPRRPPPPPPPAANDGRPRSRASTRWTATDHHLEAYRRLILLEGTQSVGMVTNIAEMITTHDLDDHVVDRLLDHAVRQLPAAQTTITLLAHAVTLYDELAQHPMADDLDLFADDGPGTTLAAMLRERDPDWQLPPVVDLTRTLARPDLPCLWHPPLALQLVATDDGHELHATNIGTTTLTVGDLVWSDDTGAGPDRPAPTTDPVSLPVGDNRRHPITTSARDLTFPVTVTLTVDGHPHASTFGEPSG